MTSLNVDLPDAMIEFIDTLVGPEGYRDRQSAIRAAVADWQEASADLMAAIEVGLDAEAAGDFEEVDDLEAWFEQFKADTVR